MMEVFADNASSALPSSPPREALAWLRQMRLPGSGTRAPLQRGAVQPCMAVRGGSGCLRERVRVCQCQSVSVSVCVSVCAAVGPAGRRGQLHRGGEAAGLAGGGRGSLISWF